MRKEQDIKIRVPSSMKAALEKIAASRMTTTSEIAREALLAYLAARNITVHELNETPAAGPAPQSATVTTVTYRRKRKSRLSNHHGDASKAK